MKTRHAPVRRVDAAHLRSYATSHPTTAAAVQAAHTSTGELDRYRAVKQYSRSQVIAVWAAAAVPMGVLAWIGAPLLEDWLGGRDPFAEALLICLTTGLAWQFVLTLVLVRHELGGLQW